MKTGIAALFLTTALLGVGVAKAADTAPAAEAKKDEIAEACGRRKEGR